MIATLVLLASIGQHHTQFDANRARLEATVNRARETYPRFQVPRPYDFSRNPYAYGAPGIYDPTAPPVGPGTIGYGTYQVAPTYVPFRFRYPGLAP